LPSSVFPTIASSEDSTIAASRACAASARCRSPTSIRMLTAPATRPRPSRIGVACARPEIRVPSGRSTTISFPLWVSPVLIASAIQHSGCGIGDPSEAKSRNDPHHRSAGWLSLGREPHSSAAGSLKKVIRPSASQV